MVRIAIDPGAGIYSIYIDTPNIRSGLTDHS